MIEQIQVIRVNDFDERWRRYAIRWTDLKLERGRQLPVYKDIASYILPERGRFLATDHNKPRDTGKILNNVPTRMAHALAAGLMSGVTSPARPWFNLTLPDPRLTELDPVKRWLWTYNQMMKQVIDLSGFYRVCAMGVYPDLCGFGTGVSLHEEDAIRLMRFTPLAVGTYALAQNGRGEIDTLFYEEAWSIGELVKEFGWSNVSDTVRTMWNSGHYDKYMSVLRVIEPNEEFLPGAFGRRGMRWGSVWMELGGTDATTGALSQSFAGPGQFLRESGYHEFPVMCPRWMTTARDVYGSGPGHDALPDCKMLMTLEKRALLGLAKGVNPPMLFPEVMRTTRLSTLPGDPIYVPQGVTQKIEAAQIVNPSMLDHAEQKIAICAERIGQAFFAPLMMLFIQQQGSGEPNRGKQPVTAAEVAAKRQEQMLQLGPVLENLNDFLSRFIDRTAAIMSRRGIVPPAPRIIQGMPLKVEFISILFQAQKMIGLQAKQQMLQYVGQLAQLKGPEATDVLDTDMSANLAADDLGIPPDMMATPEARQQARAQRAQEKQAMMQGQAMAAAAKGAKDLGGASVAPDTLLSRLAGPIGNAQVDNGEANAA